MSKLLSIVLANKSLVITIVIIAALLAGLGVQTVRLAGVRAEVVKAESKLALCSADASRTAARLEEIQGEASRREALNAHAQEEAKRKASVLEKRLAAIQRAKVPESCEAAVDWAAEQAKALGAW